MKKVIKFIGMLGIIYSSSFLNAQCVKNQLLISEYERDINNLAVRRMFEVKSPDTARVTVPQRWKDTIEEKLSAIFLENSIPQRDSIFGLYCIHDWNGGKLQSVRSYLITYDTSQQWTQAWTNGGLVTGNAYIDTLVSKFQLGGLQNIGFMPGTIVLSTPLFLNPLALADTFKLNSGILYFQENSALAVGDKIHYTSIETTSFFDFTFGWDDCPSGCINTATWKYQVDNNCQVTYLNREDAIGTNTALPQGNPNCGNLLSIEKENLNHKLQVYPNPTHDVVNIQLENENITLIELCTIEGKILKTINNSFTFARLDVSDLGKGLYVLTVHTENNKQANKRLIIE